MDWSIIVEQTPSIGMALLFAWFALRLVESQRKFIRDLMDDWIAGQQERDARWQEALCEHDERMREIFSIVVNKDGSGG